MNINKLTRALEELEKRERLHPDDHLVLYNDAMALEGHIIDEHKRLGLACDDSKAHNKHPIVTLHRRLLSGVHDRHFRKV